MEAAKASGNEKGLALRYQDVSFNILRDVREKADRKRDMITHTSSSQRSQQTTSIMLRNTCSHSKILLSSSSQKLTCTEATHLENKSFKPGAHNEVQFVSLFSHENLKYEYAAANANAYACCGVSFVPVLLRSNSKYCVRSYHHHS